VIGKLGFGSAVGRSALFNEQSNTFCYGLRGI